MDVRALAHIDLNLLVALQVLLEERSVSVAAQRLFVTQSAMSKTLGRLRELFGDRLFTRRGGEMVPTARAEQIAAELSRVLRGVEGIVLPPEFDPREFEGEFLLEVPEYIAQWAIPLLFQHLGVESPGIRINTAVGEGQHLELMAAGKLDFTIQIERLSYEPQFRVKTLGFAPPRLIVRKGHPLEGTDADWETILRYPVIRLYIPDAPEAQAFSLLRSELARQLGAKEPLLRTQHMSTALEVLRATDCIFPGPPFFIQQQDLSSEVTTLPLPGGEEVMMKFVIVYHERVEQSAPHQYLLSRILAAVEHYRLRNGLPNLEKMRSIRSLAY